MGTTADPKYNFVRGPSTVLTATIISQDRVRPRKSHINSSFSFRFSTCQTANFSLMPSANSLACAFVEGFETMIFKMDLSSLKRDVV